MENEDGAGNPGGNAPLPHNTGVGVSTRRTTYVVVSKTNESALRSVSSLALPPCNLSQLHLRL